jgi:hypothetical protein
VNIFKEQHHFFGPAILWTGSAFFTLEILEKIFAASKVGDVDDPLCFCVHVAVDGFGVVVVLYKKKYQMTMFNSSRSTQAPATLELNHMQSKLCIKK